MNIYGDYGGAKSALTSILDQYGNNHWDGKLWESLDSRSPASTEYLMDPYKYDLIRLDREKERECKILDPELLELPVITLTLADCFMLRRHFDRQSVKTVALKDQKQFTELVNMIEDVCYAAENGTLLEEPTDG